MSADFFGQVGQFVHEADLGGQHRVGRVLREFRGAHVHDDETFVIAGDGVVQEAH
jgi:hypothetical protein